MTRRDVLTKAVALDVFTDEEKAVFQKMIEQLDKKSSKPTKAQLENEVIKGDILEIVADGHARTAKESGAEVKDEQASRNHHGWFAHRQQSKKMKDAATASAQHAEGSQVEA